MLASQDALEVMPVSESVTPVFVTLLLWLWWGRIPIEDLIDVTLVSEDTDGDDEDDEELSCDKSLLVIKVIWG